MNKEKLMASVLLALIVGMFVATAYIFGLAIEGISEGVAEWLGT